MQRQCLLKKVEKKKNVRSTTLQKSINERRIFHE